MDSNFNDKEKISFSAGNTKDQQIFTPIKQMRNQLSSNFLFQPQKLMFVETPHKAQSEIFMRLLSEQKEQNQESNDYSYINYQEQMMEDPSQQQIQQSIIPTTVKKTAVHFLNSLIDQQKQKKQVHQVKKGCHCRRSNCRKNYCQCFKANQVCSQHCECTGCNNCDKVFHQQKKKEKQLTKIIFCNCKKSECNNNYCQCHSFGQKCSESCNCIECKNNLESGITKKISKFDIYEEHQTAKKKKMLPWNQ